VDDLAVVREALGGLAAAGETGPVTVAVVAEALRTRLESSSSGGGFLSGGVTFCAFQPMRSVPSRVLCVLGLSDDTFPRRRPVPEFDLMARHPAPGDASRGEDDRYLFLETVLSARERLYLSHPGLSVRDGTEAPPSVVVADLLDTLAERWGDDVAKDLVVRHRLHPWSADHFVGNPRRFTHSAGAARAARLLSGPRRLPARFCADPLEDPDGGQTTGPVAEASEPGVILLADLQAFAANPARWFLERRLGLRLPKDDEILAVREPFALEGLGRHGLRTELVEHFLGEPTGSDPGPASWKETGRLPLGETGMLAWEDEVSLMRRFAGAVGEARGDGGPQERVLRLRVGKRLLVGRVAVDAAGGPLRHRPARVRARDLLALWIDLLACRAADLDAAPDRPSSSVGRWIHLEKDEPKRLELRVPGDPRAELAAWLDLMETSRRKVVPAFPECGLAYAGGVAEEENPTAPEAWRREAALRVAREAWDGSERVRGEGSDPCFTLCFSRLGEDPFDPEFERISVERFLPLFRAAEESKPKRSSKGGRKAAGAGGAA
jgi:exodeoxyribonuclease V gamma subunit